MYDQINWQKFSFFYQLAWSILMLIVGGMLSEKKLRAFPMRLLKLVSFVLPPILIGQVIALVIVTDYHPEALIILAEYFGYTDGTGASILVTQGMGILSIVMTFFYMFMIRTLILKSKAEREASELLDKRVDQSSTPREVNANEYRPDKFIYDYAQRFGLRCGCKDVGSVVSLGSKEYKKSIMGRIVNDVSISEGFLIFCDCGSVTLYSPVDHFVILLTPVASSPHGCTPIDTLNLSHIQHIKDYFSTPFTRAFLKKLEPELYASVEALRYYSVDCAIKSSNISYIPDIDLFLSRLLKFSKEFMDFFVLDVPSVGEAERLFNYILTGRQEWKV